MVNERGNTHGRKLGSTNKDYQGGDKAEGKYQPMNAGSGWDRWDTLTVADNTSHKEESMEDREGRRRSVLIGEEIGSASRGYYWRDEAEEISHCM